MTADQVATRCGSKPVGEALQLVRGIEPGLNSEPLRDRCRSVTRPLEIRRVDVGETGVLEHFRQQLGALPSRGDERRIRGFVQFLSVAHEVYDCRLLLDLTLRRCDAEPRR